MLTENMESFVKDTQSELFDLIRALAPIPAPSHHEDKRVEFLVDYLRRLGAEGVYVDDAKNVIWPYNVTEDNDLIVFMAHTDVVFPDTTPLPFSENEEFFFCPGIGDDTARLCQLLTLARYFVFNNIKTDYGILFVANSCEEGLGNLKGSRMICDTFGKRIKNFISDDGSLDKITTIPVGSLRYKITVKTPGGHSYGAFGNENAIQNAALLINELYKVEVPHDGDSKTTYNVGGITGGTSVNTIAQDCELLYEYRSTSAKCLEIMKENLYAAIEKCTKKDVEFTVELLGERPCMGKVDEVELEKLYARFDKAAKEIQGLDSLERKSGSTDSNYPLSIGIPAVTFGSATGGKAHTREEFVRKDGFYIGSRYFMDVMASYFNI